MTKHRATTTSLRTIVTAPTSVATTDVAPKGYTPKFRNGHREFLRNYFLGLTFRPISGILLLDQGTFPLGERDYQEVLVYQAIPTMVAPRFVLGLVPE